MTQLRDYGPWISFGTFVFILIAKLAAFRHLLFGDLSLGRLLWVELPVWLLVPVLLIVVLKRINVPAMLIYQLLLSMLMVAVLWYERYFGTIPSYYDLKQSGQAGSVLETVGLLYAPVDLLFFADVIVWAALLLFYWKRPLEVGRMAAGIAMGVLVVLTAGSTFLALQKPLTDVALFAKEQGFVQTQLAQAYKPQSVGYAEVVDLTPEELERLKGNEFVPYTDHDRFGVAQGRHLFVIQVESLQEFAIGQELAGQELTPNLNELLEDSLYFDRMFQQIGAGNTSDAEWLLHTSLYTRGLEPTVNYLTENELPSLVRLLNEEGYYTTTYHADSIDYWNRKQLYPSLGFQKFFTKEDMPEGEVIGIGLSDEVLFDFAAGQVREQIAQGKQIYANLVTMTSHTPFEVPEEQQLLQLPAAYEETYTGNYLQAIRYADEQVGKFIDFLKSEGLYEESLIAVNGDHSGLHGTPMTPEDNELMADLLGHSYTLKDRFQLPFIVAAPGLFEGEVISHVGGQVDMMPTLTNLLGIVPDAPIAGHNMLQYENNLLTMRYYLSGGSFMTEEEMFLAENARFPARYHNLDTMEKMTDIPASIEETQQDAQQLLDYSDALLQNYLNGNKSQ